ISRIASSPYAPHQVVSKGSEGGHYYIRAGSNFEPTPHGVLAGLFGRRPAPHLFMRCGQVNHRFHEPPAATRVNAAERNRAIYFDFQPLIENTGRSIVQNIFCVLRLRKRPSLNSSLNANLGSAIPRRGAEPDSYSTSFVSPPEFRLPPSANL